MKEHKTPEVLERCSEDRDGLQLEPSALPLQKPHVHILLVHGTWAFPLFWCFMPSRLRERFRPGWFDTRSDFCDDVGNRLQDSLVVTFESFVWSGRNSCVARAKAAKKLGGLVAQHHETQPHTPLFIIAHSHGGNVAVRAMRDLAPQQQPTGVATLATPFLYVNRRTLSRMDSAMLQVASLGVFFALFFGVVSIVERWGWPAGVLMGLGWLLFSGYFHNRPYTIRNIVERLIDQAGTPAPHNLNLLALRCPGDEASVGLASAQFFAIVTDVLWRLLRIPSALVFFFTETLMSIMQKSYKLWFVLAAAMLLVLVFGSKHDGSPFSGTLSEEENPIAAWLFFGLLAVYILPFLTVFLFLVVSALVVPPVIALFSLFLLPFGIEMPLLGPWIQASAETVPRGRWPVMLLDPGAGMRHSVHALPAARECLAEWIKSFANIDKQ